MNSYLILNDYKSYIQAQYFNQLFQGDDTKRLIDEQNAIISIVSRLKQKYDLDAEFKVMNPWSPILKYGATDRVYLDASLYNASSYYVGNDLCLYQGNIYICTGNTTSTFDPSKWTLLGAQYDIFYARYPPAIYRGEITYPSLTSPNNAVFNYLNVYLKDDLVWWKGATYVCARGTELPSHSSIVADISYSNVPIYNVFPDDPINNNNGQYWTDRTTYAIDRGILPTVATYWVKGDNRNPIILRCIKAMVVYNLSTNIASNNVPERWHNEYEYAMETLKSAADGDITLDLRLIQPNSGMKIRYGGNTKINSIY